MLFIKTLLVQTSKQKSRSHLVRYLAATPAAYKRVGFSPKEDGEVPARKNFREPLLPVSWLKLIDKYPDFLPNPLNNSPLLVSQTVDDMIKRRTVIEIPQFYVGSILRVVVSDTYSETKRSKFTGICIDRSGQLMNATFTLRNIIDGMGCEIRYDLYNPLIISIEVLKLEKRLDDCLMYLRDALPEYSTIPEDMKPIILEENAEVPLNKTLVKMKPQPWSRKWERHLLRGIEKFEDIPLYFAQKVWAVENDATYTYDLMMEYRRHATEEMMYLICKKLAEHENTVVKERLEAKQKRFIRMTKSL